MDFEKIYSEYFDTVYGYVLSLCKSEALAEEIAQDTFFKALKKIKTFRGDCKLSVWLCQIAKNTFYTEAKKAGWQADYPLHEEKYWKCYGIVSYSADCGQCNGEGKINYHTLKPVLFEMPTYEYLRTGEVIGNCMSLGKELEADNPIATPLYSLSNKNGVTILFEELSCHFWSGFLCCWLYTK